MAEVDRKFKWIPHYSKIHFAFGIAIAGNLLKMKAFSRQQNEVASTEVSVCEAAAFSRFAAQR